MFSMLASWRFIKRSKENLTVFALRLSSNVSIQYSTKIWKMRKNEIRRQSVAETAERVTR